MMEPGRVLLSQTGVQCGGKQLGMTFRFPGYIDFSSFSVMIETGLPGVQSIPVP